MAQKKTVSAKEVVADIRAGATDEFLMKKYGISEKGLQSLLEKLVDAGALKRSGLGLGAKSLHSPQETAGIIPCPPTSTLITRHQEDKNNSGQKSEEGRDETPGYSTKGQPVQLIDQPEVLAIEQRELLSGDKGIGRFEVRPRSKRNGILAAVGCSIFVVVGVAMVLDGKFIPGLLAMAFFGGGGFIAVPKLLRRPVSMVLTAQGIEQITPYGSANISWLEVERIGVVSVSSTKMVGIKLKSYDSYVESMSPAMAANFTKYLPYLKAISYLTVLVKFSTVRKFWSFGKVGNISEAMSWSRKQFGYDVMFGWADLDRSVTKFVTLLGQYRTSAVP